MSARGALAGVAPLLIVLGLIAGCGAAAGPSGAAPSPRITCVGIPTEKCDEAVASVKRSLPDAALEAIDVTCISAGCTASSGSMDTVVTLPGGRRLHANPLTWGNGGGPALPPGAPALPVTPICLGVPDDKCREVAGSEFPAAPSHGGVVKIVVSCTRKPCTAQKGEGTTVVTFGDGTEDSSAGWGYEEASGG